MTVVEMVRQLKAAGYSVIKTENLTTLHSEFCVDQFELASRHDIEGFLEYNQKRACSQFGHMIADQLFGFLQFKKRCTDKYIDTYRAEITIVKP